MDKKILRQFLVKVRMLRREPYLLSELIENERKKFCHLTLKMVIGGQVCVRENL